MKKISIILLLMISLFSLILTGCEEVGITPGIDSENSEYQGDMEEPVTGEVDTTKPVITGSQDPLPNASGWNNTDVTVSFSCEDVGSIQSGIETNTVAGKIVTTEGENQSVTNTGVLIDAAGNVADPVTVSNINIDKTPPVVTINLPGTGEYVLNQSVTTTWSATDALSGVVSPVSGTVSIDTSSMGTKTLTLPAGTVMDKVGNSSREVTISYSVIADIEEPLIGEVDTTKPVITGSRDPLPNASGWNNTDVTVSFSCEDVGSIQSGIETNTVAGKIVTTEGENQSVTNTGVLIDAAGNIADPVTVSNINIDKTPPVVTINLPGTGEYVLNQSVTTTWSATDALSGAEDSKAPKTVKIDTKSVGKKKITLPPGLIKDKAGNNSLEVTISYSVIADTEEPVIVDTEDPGTVYPQKWATGTGTVGDPWANNCIKKAYDACPADGTVFLKAGYYQLSGHVTLSKKVNIIGEGRDKTIVKTADTYGFLVITDYCTIKGMTIDGAAQSPGEDYMCINAHDCDYLVIEEIEGINSFTAIQPNRVNNSIFRNLYLHDNEHLGMHPINNVAGRGINNTFQNIWAWNNGDRGIDAGSEVISGITNNVYDNIHCWNNGGNGINPNTWGHGLAITYEKGIVISNCELKENTGNGIYLRGIEDSTVSNCSITLNGTSGILLSADIKNVNFTNVIVKNNGTGINTYNSSNLVFTSCQSYDDRTVPLQSYGIELRESSEINLINCKLSPNKYADLYDPAGVADIITEKMLAKL